MFQSVFFGEFQISNKRLSFLLPFSPRLIQTANKDVSSCLSRKTLLSVMLLFLTSILYAFEKNELKENVEILKQEKMLKFSLLQK